MRTPLSGETIVIGVWGFSRLVGVVGVGALLSVWGSRFAGGSSDVVHPGGILMLLDVVFACPDLTCSGLFWSCFVGSMGLVLRSWGGGSDPAAWCWFGASLVLISGVAGAIVRACCVTVRFGRAVRERFGWWPAVLEVILRRCR